MMSKEEFARTSMKSLLQRLGIYPNMAGYSALTECVVEAVRREGNVSCKICEIYNSVAKKSNRSYASIERSIRFGIFKSVCENKIDILNTYFGFDVCNERYSIRNSELIALLGEKLCDEYEAASK